MIQIQAKNLVLVSDQLHLQYEHAGSWLKNRLDCKQPSASQRAGSKYRHRMCCSQYIYGCEFDI